MKIERIKDRIFQISLSETEADRLADVSETDFAYVRQYTSNFGRIILNYIIDCCTYPTSKSPSFDLEL